MYFMHWIPFRLPSNVYQQLDTTGFTEFISPQREEERRGEGFIIASRETVYLLIGRAN